MKCCFSECSREAKAKGLCLAHYNQRWWGQPLTKLRAEKLAVECLWEKINKDGPIVRPELGPCWVWMGYTVNGYGRLTFAGRRIATHRYSWELCRGPIPDGLEICHRCDNPPCCNPDHMFVGTARDNALDRTVKQRHNAPRGEQVFFAKLTAPRVQAIRSLSGAGFNARYVAALFDVCAATVRLVRARTIWRHVP